MKMIVLWFFMEGLLILSRYNSCVLFLWIPYFFDSKSPRARARPRSAAHNASEKFL